MTVLVTGVAGFIGAAVAEAVLSRGEAVVGIDNFNSYYNPALKRARLQRLQLIHGAPERLACVELHLEDGGPRHHN